MSTSELDESEQSRGPECARDKKRVRWQEGQPSHLEGSVREGSLRVVCPLVGNMMLASVGISVGAANLRLLDFGQLGVVAIALRRIQPEQAGGYTLRRRRGDRGRGNQRDQSGQAENEKSYRGEGEKTEATDGRVAGPDGGGRSVDICHGHGDGMALSQDGRGGSKPDYVAQGGRR